MQSFEGSVEIETARLKLREFADYDAHAIQAYAGDPEVTRHTSFGPNTTAVTASVLASWIEERLRVPRLEWPLAIVRKEDQVLIGGTGLGSVNWSAGEAAFGYVLRRSMWGQGYATEAGRAVRDWALSQLALRRLVAHCEESNVTSLAVLKKLGFRQEGRVTMPRVSGEMREYLTFVIERP